ncbi:MAG TPA: hypothetical protein VNX01_09675 [Bacteroidia bacterium]|jgi:hypothetical protein|nr:hypothetical protein [Bacteroidia bacterium]
MKNDFAMIVSYPKVQNKVTKFLKTAATSSNCNTAIPTAELVRLIKQLVCQYFLVLRK